MPENTPLGLTLGFHGRDINYNLIQSNVKRKLLEDVDSIGKDERRNTVVQRSPQGTIATSLRLPTTIND